jgi:penicillin-binding protein 1A
MGSMRSRHGPLRVACRLFVGAAVVTVILVAAFGAFIYDEITRDLPSVETAIEYNPPVTSQIMAADGTMIGEFYRQRRYLVPFEGVPLHVRRAFIAAEDGAFYRHQGVDATGIVRAFLNNLQVGRRIQGGSTITQQVVKSLLLTPQKSYARKLRELILALRLEHALSKDDILLLYLNHIYLGSGAYGVAAAAQEYFGKDIAQVTLAEAALLAGLPQAPSRYSPHRDWPAAKARQRYVLDRMHENGFIERAARDAAMKEPLSLVGRQDTVRSSPYFVEHVRRMLEGRYGRTVLYQLGLRVHTTLDPRMQVAAERALRGGLEHLAARLDGFRAGFRNMGQDEREMYLRLQAQAFDGVDMLDPALSYEGLVTAMRADSARVQVGPFIGELAFSPEDGAPIPRLALNDLVRVRPVDGTDPLRFEYDPGPTIEGALVAVDQHTGFIKAMVGGYDFDRSQFNRVTQAKRQPGSAFKPLVYAAALDRNFTPSSVLTDAPIAYSDHGRIWAPQNYEGKFYGPTTLRTALTRSRNVVTVKLAERIGIDYLVNYLPRFGLVGPLPRNLSIALGTFEVTPLELAYAFCAFANNGFRPAPRAITRVTDQRGQILAQNNPVTAPVIPATSAYQMTAMLQDVVERGTGTRAAGLRQATAGKTGTTNGFRDAWFVGYTPQLLAAVWVGFDDRRSIGPKETGGRVAAPIWKSFMEQVLSEEPAAQFPVAEGLDYAHARGTTGRSSSDSASHLARLDAAATVADTSPSSSRSSLEFLRNDL